ncbi:MAG: metal ABC transporter ATP-binding protein [Treponema sp.]|jgi:zinc transport system ATP-binding protein|nr:metal ABC transporter ATP-binding protein [Treponema sp.]
MAFITVEDISFAYDGNVVVQGLNFSVDPGDYFCIVGENGSGKSTLVKGILGLIHPVQGSVKRGEGIKTHEIGYLPQQRAAQKDFPAGVYEVVLSGRLSTRGIRPFYSRTDKDAAEKNLERLGIADIRNRCYRDLSGGQQQRVLLARSLCAAPKLLVLDEPAAGLDPVVSTEVYHLLETGITIIMVSHDIAGVLRYANKILHLHKEALFFGSPGAYTRSELGRRFLGVAEAHD